MKIEITESQAQSGLRQLTSHKSKGLITDEEYDNAWEFYSEEYLIIKG